MTLPLPRDLAFISCAVLLAACGSSADKASGDTSATDSGVTDTAGLSCESPGSPTTPTPTASTDAAAMNVEALACTLSPTALACELGVAHAYTETNDGTKRRITANGVANHDVGSFPNDGNPNTITAQTYSFTVPSTPGGTGSARQGVFGILFSGAVLDPATAETWNDDPNWRYEALRYGTAAAYFGSDSVRHPTALGVDCNLAHVQPSGAYHYHGVPTSMLPATPEVRQVGWAADGVPVVIQYGHAADGTLRALRGSYRVKTGGRPPGAPAGSYDGTFVEDWEYVEDLGDLDACNGHTETLTVDGTEVTTYVYVLTDTYPYIPRCFTYAPDGSFSPPSDPREEPVECGPGQTTMCCGDGVCDGPETVDNCAADCS